MIEEGISMGFGGFRDLKKIFRVKKKSVFENEKRDKNRLKKNRVRNAKKTDCENNTGSDYKIQIEIGFEKHKRKRIKIQVNI